jgi:predicted enzyme related to lactoylglutathione lyase
MAERTIHFEITADDPERAAAFYRGTFGWTITKWDGPVDYWLITSGAGLGIDGAIMPRAHDQAVMNTIQVEGSLEDAIARVQKANGTQIGDIRTIPNVGRFVYVRDTEGNVFGMMEPDGSD